ncbi:MAG TPA: ATP-dependent Clp protease ATP-binding subunit ClpX [Solirubrobacteraceae bacterium]|nr:ATP-dependent Clp protease ATP-binding subunit ClpX [Solirubrobacteraceae bacterium]
MATSRDPPDELFCSFCGKLHEEVRFLIAGPGVHICDGCLGECNEALDDGPSPAVKYELEDLPKPREIYDLLSRYVIGQDEAKRTLSVAVYNHYKRVHSADDDIELQKSNVLLLGPTGCGKTLLAQTLARVLDVPFGIADATALTEAGYVGEDVESVLLPLIRAADHDIAEAQTGILYLDEVDKIARKADGPSITRDVSGEGVQQALLKLLDGTIASVVARVDRMPRADVQIDTSKVLFICGGTFDGLDHLIERRIGRQGVGFGAAIRSVDERDVGELLAHCRPEDFVEYGLIPEFIGRLPVICPIHQLAREDLVRVLIEPRGALLRQFQESFRFDGIELVFAEEALCAIADKAIQRRAGARGLRSILEELLLDLQFELPSRGDVRRCVVTRETVDHGAPPRLESVVPELAAA